MVCTVVPHATAAEGTIATAVHGVSLPLLGCMRVCIRPSRRGTSEPLRSRARERLQCRNRHVTRRHLAATAAKGVVVIDCARRMPSTVRRAGAARFSVMYVCTYESTCDSAQPRKGIVVTNSQRRKPSKRASAARFSVSHVRTYVCVSVVG
jgi:hypothetical protein